MGIVTEEMVSNALKAAFDKGGDTRSEMRAAIRAILPDIGESFAKVAEAVHSDGWVQSESAKKWGLRCAADIRAASKGEG